MLEGLEIAEVKRSSINLGDRYDAEYFHKGNLTIETLLKSKGAVKFKELGDFVASAFYPSATELYFTGDIPFIRCVDCIPFPFITKKQDELFEKLPLKFIEEQKGINTLLKGDIVITKVGSPCFASLVDEHDFVALSRTVLGVKNIKELNKYYLITFLRSKYGFNQLLRERELTIQYQLTLERVKNILVFIPSNVLQTNIESCIKSQNNIDQRAKQLYTEAETILLQELGLANWQPTIKNNNTKTLKESFLQTGRIDAEYYQPKYDEIELRIKNYELGFDTVSNLCNVKIQNVVPKDELEYNYIELSDIGSNGNVTGCTVNIGKELPTRARRLVAENDLIVSSIEGSLSSCAIISKEFENAFCSTGFYVLNSKKINSETLLLLFKTVIIELMKKGCSGTILTGINNEEFFKIPLPIINPKTQTTISQKIQESFALQAQSKQLLEAAKLAVEIAIEQGEEEAMGYLSKL